MLQDAGEELIGNTFVLVNDIRYVDKNQGAKAGAAALKILGTVASAYTGNNDYKKLANNVGDMAETLKGFKVRINTFLYRLEWTEEQANNFYADQYTANPDETKRQNFEKNRGSYKLRYVGKVESKGSTTSFMGINES